MLSDLKKGKVTMTSVFVVAVVLFLVYHFFLKDTPKPTAPSDEDQVIVYFHMTGCPHCVQFTPTWLEFAKTSPVRTEMVESAEIQDKGYGDIPLKGFPTVFVIQDGQVVAELQERTIDGLQKLV